MAYCLPDVRDNAAIVHLSAGALPDRLPAGRLERFDHHGLLLRQGIEQLRQYHGRLATPNGGDGGSDVAGS